MYCFVLIHLYIKRGVFIHSKRQHHLLNQIIKIMKKKDNIDYKIADTESFRYKRNL